MFDGRKARPYVELDETGPLNVYGRSKLEGERAILEAHPQALILRTSWVFSPFGSNFLKTMLKVGAERPLLRVVSDQVGNPTSALDLAAAILEISPALQSEAGGLYHLTGEGSASWHGFADFIFRESSRRGGPGPGGNFQWRLQGSGGAPSKFSARLHRFCQPLWHQAAPLD